MAQEYLVGKITHYFGNIGVAVIALSATLKVGDQVHIKGVNTDCMQPVESMQVEHKNIQSAKPGDDVAIKVKDKTREGDDVYVSQ